LLGDDKVASNELEELVTNDIYRIDVKKIKEKYQTHDVPEKEDYE
jgi:hypothetical protein